MPKDQMPVAHSEASLAPEVERLMAAERAVNDASAWLAERQSPDGHFVFELEADATIPSEYVMLNHYLGEPRPEVEAKIAVYLKRIQGEHGGWPLFHGGAADLSATVKAYFALKLAGEDPESAPMRRARAAVLGMGGAERANVFTRIALALFGEVPWRATPVIRPEAVLLPWLSPFHIGKVSYWSRTVMMPLFVLAAVKPRARNPTGVRIQELFKTPPERVRKYLGNPTGRWQGEAFLALDRLGRLCEPFFPKAFERYAVGRAMAWVRERLNGQDGLGGIFPAMANAVMAFDAMGYARDHPEVKTARAAIERLLVFRDGEAYCQPCLSPVWDTALAFHAVLEAGEGEARPSASRAADWLVERQILDVAGDWAERRKDVRPGGWAFQYANPHYPDVDDTAAVAMALHRLDPARYREPVARAAEWVIGMQGTDGGWGAFDADNDHRLLNHIPFADHGALLDPSTADVTARCVGFLAQLGDPVHRGAIGRGLDFLRASQEPDGSWFGRWGTNYVYGTWSVLAALNAADEDLDAPHVKKAVAWLKARQNADGGWGEDCASYWTERRGEPVPSTPSQTAWALLGLMAAGEVGDPAVQRGVDHLLSAPRQGGRWDEKAYNAVGFPRVFYLHYHGYPSYFPIWALARYRRLVVGNTRRPAFGI